MNFRTLFCIFFFGLIGLTTTSFAQSIFWDEIEVLQGSTLPIQLTSKSIPPQIKSEPIEGNVLELVSNGGNSYTVNYTPAADFLGPDGFTIETIEYFDPFNPDNTVKHWYVFLIDVVSSIVNTNDDYIHLTSQDEIIIDPLANDEITSTNLTVTVAQVLRGTAIVNEDQTISYTPIDDNPDYIIYTVIDELNTISKSTIYITQETAVSEELTVEEFEIASGNSQVIILPNDDFTLNVESYEFGSVEQISPFVFEYTSEANVVGGDVVNFTDSNDNVFQASISVIEKYTDDGFVKDDVFYSASNTNIEFNVTLNDVTDQYVISDYSEELIHQGSGVFSYTPPPYFSGEKTFTYTADDGISEETGTITLIINNYKPTNTFEYNLSTPQNQPRVIEYDVPLGTEFFQIAALPIHGTIEVFTEDESVDVGCDEGIQKVFALYTPDTDYVGVDDLTIRYCASDNNICSNVNIIFDVVASESEDCICVDDCVWPGDANGDGKVSVVDALSIGRFIGNGGAARLDSPFGDAYEGSSADDWFVTQANGKNLKHADADGNGLITAEDLDIVVANYGDINSIISADVLGIKNIPFLLTTETTEVDSGDLMVINVIIGSEAFPAVDVHGVAFAVNLPASLVDSSTVEVEYLESKYLVKGAPYLSLTHQPVDGIIHTAGTKTNSLGSTGSGIVATVSFIVEENAEGIKNPKRSVSNAISDIVATIEATDIIIEDSRGFKYALPNTSLDIVVKSGANKINDLTSRLIAYPNPSSDFVKIESEDGSILNSLKVYSLDGRLVKSVNQINTNNIEVQTNDLEDGLYILKATTETGIISTRMIKN